MTDTAAAGLEGFAAELAAIVQADPAAVRGESRLVADLDFDSLAFVELAVLLMDRYDSRNFMAAVSGEIDVDAQTVESIYENYAR
jgi:acyl carrier protein